MTSDNEFFDVNAEPKMEEPTPELVQPVPAGSSSMAPLSPEEERTWAMVAHLGVFVNLFTGFLGPLVPLLIYLIYKDRSRYVRFQAFQAFIFQLVYWIGGMLVVGAVWLFVGLLSAIFIGVCLIPFAFILSLFLVVPYIYGIVGAVKTYQGEDFRYWLIDEWSASLM